LIQDNIKIIIKDQNRSRALLAIAGIILSLLFAPLYETYTTFLYKLMYTASLPMSVSEETAYSMHSGHPAPPALLLKAAASARVAGARNVVICASIHNDSPAYISENLLNQLSSGKPFALDLLTQSSIQNTVINNFNKYGQTTIFAPSLVAENRYIGNNEPYCGNSFLPLFSKSNIYIKTKIENKTLLHISAALYSLQNKDEFDYKTAEPFYYDTFFQKSPLIRIDFNSLANYPSLIEEKNIHLALLADYTDHKEFSDISDGLLQLLNRALSHPEDKTLRDMFLLAHNDTAVLSKQICDKADSINMNDLDPKEKEGITEAINELNRIDNLLKPIEEINGKTIFIEDFAQTGYSHNKSPRFFGKSYTPGEQSAFLYTSMINHTTRQRCGFFAQFVILIVISSLIWFIFYKYPYRLAFKYTLYAFIFFNIVYYIILNLTGFRFDLSYMHVLFGLTAAGLLAEQNIRITWFNRLRKETGLNISPITIEKIASSIKPVKIPESTNGALLYIQILNLPEVAAILSSKDFTAIINELNDVFRTDCEKNEGVLVSLERGVFCCAYGFGFSGLDPVNEALETALTFDKCVKSANRYKIMLKKDIQFQCSTAIDYAPISSRISSRGDYNILTLYGSILSVVRSMIRISTEYGAPIVITEDALGHIDTLCTWRALDKVKFPFCNITTTLYQILGGQELHSPLSDFLNIFEEGQKLFYQKQFKEARSYFRKASRLYSGDGPSLYFIKKCAYYLKTDSNLKRTVDIADL